MTYTDITTTTNGLKVRKHKRLQAMPAGAHAVLAYDYWQAPQPVFCCSMHCPFTLLSSTCTVGIG